MNKKEELWELYEELEDSQKVKWLEEFECIYECVNDWFDETFDSEIKRLKELKKVN